MWKNAIFDKYTKFNAPPQVFVSLNEPNGLELWKRSHVLFCSQVVKWHFAARELFFFVLFNSFLVIQITGVKNFTNKNVSVTSPLSCISSPKIVVALHKPWAYTTTSGWLRGWSLFVLAGRVFSPVRILYWKKCEFDVHMEMSDTSTTEWRFVFSI